MSGFTAATTLTGGEMTRTKPRTSGSLVRAVACFIDDNTVRVIKVFPAVEYKMTKAGILENVRTA